MPHRATHDCTRTATTLWASPEEPQIEVRYVCEHCDGSGRVPDDPAAVGRVEMSKTHACPECQGTGESRRMWVGHRGCAIGFGRWQLGYAGCAAALTARLS